MSYRRPLWLPMGSNEKSRRHGYNAWSMVIPGKSYGRLNLRHMSRTQTGIHETHTYSWEPMRTHGSSSGPFATFHGFPWVPLGRVSMTYKQVSLGKGTSSCRKPTIGDLIDRAFLAALTGDEVRTTSELLEDLPTLMSTRSRAPSRPASTGSNSTSRSSAPETT